MKKNDLKNFLNGRGLRGDLVQFIHFAVRETEAQEAA